MNAVYADNDDEAVRTGANHFPQTTKNSRTFHVCMLVVAIIPVGWEWLVNLNRASGSSYLLCLGYVNIVCSREGRNCTNAFSE